MALIKLSDMGKCCSVCGSVETDGLVKYCSNCNMLLTKVNIFSQDWNPRLEMYTLKLNMVE